MAVWLMRAGSSMNTSKTRLISRSVQNQSRRMLPLSAGDPQSSVWVRWLQPNLPFLALPSFWIHGGCVRLHTLRLVWLFP